jgi:hypothetical protein
MCNKLLSLGVFPTRLKHSQLSPIFKKGDRTDVKNYRPISLLTSFSKIFEKVVYNKLQYHHDINNILVHEHGFQTKLSTDSANHDLINTILSALNNKLVVRGLFCDLTKGTLTLVLASPRQAWPTLSDPYTLRQVLPHCARYSRKKQQHHEGEMRLASV